MKNILRILIGLLIIGNTAFSQGYKIKVKIDGLRDTAIYLGYHFGDKKYVTDTVQLDSKGVGVFEGANPLEGGIYLVVLPAKTYFEILVDKDQNFFIETDTSVLSSDYLRNIKISGSIENSQFYAYQIFMSDENKKAGELRKQLQENKGNKEKTKEINDKMSELDKEVKAYWEKIRTENPDGVLALVLNALTDIEVPEAPTDENGVITDSTFRYRYYKNHYFDHIDFSDRRILRTPVYHNKLKFFFDKIVLQHPDTLIAEVHRIVNKAKADSLMFQYTLQYLFNLYNSSNIMGFDEVFVDIAEDYYLAGYATWADSAFLAKIAERVIKLKPNILGQTAPDMKLPSYDGQYYRLHDLNSKATIIVFWDPDCGHCKKEIPKLHKLYNEIWEKGVEVFAVYTQVDKENWEKFIEEHGLSDWINVYDPYNTSNFRTNYDIYSTPVIYILDENKKIVAKRIDLDTIKIILDEEFGIKTKPEEDSEQNKSENE